METIFLREGIDQLVQFTEALKLSEQLLSRYRKHYEEIFVYCLENDLETFCRKDAEKFCEHHCHGQKHYAVMEITKIAYTAANYFETGVFKWKAVTFTNYPIGAVFQKIEDNFRQELMVNLSPGTVRTGIVITRQFMYFLEQRGIFVAKEISINDVLDFIKQEAPNHKQSMPKLLRTIRKLVCYLCKEGLADINTDLLFDKAGRCRQKALPCFTDEEIRCIFAQIDRTSDIGKRDYAIFLLALRTGLRACDIASLKLDDIDWIRKTIKVVQEKTKVSLELPLPIDVGNVIADYILHSRYISENPYVFLRIRNTTNKEPINPSAFNNSLRKYYERAGFDRKGWDGKSFHAFRRTAGTKMVEAKVPITTVAQVLGHGKIESTKRYIALDTKSPMGCGLDLNELKSRKEGLR